MRGRFNSGSGSKVNGIIKEYVCASDKIEAGDFVNFTIKSNDNVSIFKEIERPDKTVDLRQIKVIAISSTKVLIMYIQNKNANSYFKIIGNICTIENNSMTVHPSFELLNASTSGEITDTSFSAIAVNENRILLLFGESDRAEVYLLGIDNNIVTILKSDAVVDKHYSKCSTNKGSSIVKITDNKYLLSFSFGVYVYSIVCTIADNTLSLNGTTNPDKTNDLNLGRGGYLSTIALSENYYINIGTAENDGVIYCKIFTVSGNSVSGYGTGITTGKNIVVGTQKPKLRTVKLNDNSILIVYKNATDDCMYGVICNIDSDKNITFTTVTKLSDTTTYDFSILSIDDEIVIIFNKMNYLNLTIDNNEITVKSEKELTDNTYNSNLIYDTINFNGKIFGTFSKISADDTLTAFTFDTITRVSKVENKTEPICGISKTKASQGEKIKVYVPLEN